MIRSLPRFALAALMSVPFAQVAFATTITPTFGAAGAETADQGALCAGAATCVVGVETYNTRSTADFTNGFTTDFGTSGAITGSYKAASGANLVVTNDTTYGNATTPAPAAGTTAQYPELYSGSYTLNLATSGVPGVNYFGLWISALDANNDLKFYSGGALVLDFTPVLMTQYIQMMPNSAAYKGNPSNGADTGEYFSFVNFTATSGTFDTVVFSNSPGTGFESDNATVAYRSTNAVIGNPIPEPASLLIGLAGLAGLGLVRLRRGRAA